MAIETIKVPDIGGAENVDIIELSVAAGDSISVEDVLITLESDKASMDIPSPLAGKVVKLLVGEGDKVSEGDAILEIETEASSSEASASDASAPAASAEQAPAAASSAGAEQEVKVPDIGGSENVDVIEICVAVGDAISEGDSIIVLESDKASMEVPAPASGTVKSISIKEGDKVSEGSVVLVLEVSGSAAPAAAPAQEAAPAPAAPAAAQDQDVTVPDIGGAEGVDIIEVCVAVGDDVNEGDSIIVLESDKASMEVPAPFSGKVKSLAVKEGDKVSMGDLIGQFSVAGAAAPAAQAPAPQASAPSSAPAAKAPAPAAASAPAAPVGNSKNVYAGPAVRKLARELGVDLGEVSSTGPRGRIQKDDLHNFVKQVMKNRASGGSAAVSGGSGIPAIPEVDFSKFGDVELVKMSKIKKVTAANMSRNWLNVPHVTQFDDVDITEMEAFRKSMKAEAEKAGVKLTPVPFLLKACAAALKAEPSFNVSMHADGEHIVHKKYIHIGMAVDTPNGLMVPVIRDVDKKSLFELSEEAVTLAKKARDGKLMPKDMQGGCFTISSLGAIGGTGFTPIVNAPEVAILGVSRADTKPVWDGKAFVPRLMLPLCLSYDHRAINGGDAGRFFTYLSSMLQDIRRLLL